MFMNSHRVAYDVQKLSLLNTSIPYSTVEKILSVQLFS